MKKHDIIRDNSQIPNVIFPPTTVHTSIVTQRAFKKSTQNYLLSDHCLKARNTKFVIGDILTDVGFKTVNGAVQGVQQPQAAAIPRH